MTPKRNSASRYILGYIALLVVISINLGLSFLDLGEWGMPVAMVLASISILIVVLIFMHLLEHAPTAWLVMMTVVFFLVLLSSLMILDVISRTPEPPPPYFEDAFRQELPRRPG